MSRSGYTEDGEQWDMIRWRGAVASALRGKRGQAFLREALAALDALPAPELIANDLATPSGSYCTLGAVGRSREIDTAKVDPEDHYSVADLFGIPHALACEIMWENDDGVCGTETAAHRWARMRRWIVRHLRVDPAEAALAAEHPSPTNPEPGSGS